MTPEQYQRVIDVFTQACDLSEAERSALLDAQPADVRRDVLSLLDHDQADQNIADRAAAKNAAWTFLDPGTPEAVRPLPERIAGYRPLRILGDGGMGVVYEAQQERPSRRVALKVIRSHSPSPEIVRRFEREAELLGRLHHPAIAQVYDAGTFEGEPYLAMELIRGRPLDEVARELPVRQRLPLLASVCDAVQHAHQNRILHRDLKPANVLVDDRLQPKVLDFGVARVLDAEADATLQTLPGQVIGTLDYMSPEQLSGGRDNVDTRADVYAIGVMLYEVIAGRRPFDLRRMSIAEAAVTIRDTDPLRIERIAIQVPSDLATIVHTAIARERDRRYQSADALGSDIQHFLRHEPIQARPATTIYVLHKFARRHKILVSAVALTVLGLTLGLWIALAGLTEAEFARDRAEHALHESEAVTDFLVRSLEYSNPLQHGGDVTVRQMLDQMAATLPIELAARPGVESRLSEVAGRSYRALGDFDRANRLLDRAQELFASRSGDAEDSKALSIATTRAQVLADRGDHSASLRELDAAHAQARETFAADDPLALRILEARAHALLHLDRHDEAVVELMKILELRQAAIEPDSLAIAATRHNLGFVLRDIGRVQEGERYLRDALAGLRASTGSDHPLVAHALVNLGGLLQRRGQLDEAHRLLEEAVVIQERIFDRPHPTTAEALAALGDVAQSRGQFVAAEATFRRVIGLHRELLDPGHPLIGRTLARLAIVLREQGDLAGAEDHARRALAELEAGGKHNRTEHAWAQGVLGTILAQRGSFEEAERLQLDTLATYTAVHGRTHPDTIDATSRLALVYLGTGDLTTAAELMGQVLEVRRTTQGEDHPDVTIALFNAGSTDLRAGRFDAAVSRLTQAHDRFSRELGAEHPNVFRAMASLARALVLDGQPDRAIPLAASAALAFADSSGPLHRRTIGANATLAVARVDAGDPTAALQIMGPLVASAGDALGDSEPVARLLLAYGRALAGTGDFEHAEAALLEAHAIVVGLDTEPKLVVDAVRRALVEFYELRRRPEDAARWR